MRLDRWSFLRMAVLLLAISLFAAFAACSSSDKKDKTPTSGDQTPSSQQSPSAQGSPSDGGGGGDGGGDASADISQLAEEWANSQGVIAYEYTTTAAGQETTGAMTLYWQPPNWRFDYDAGDGTTSTTMLVDGKSYVCGGDACIAYPSPDAVPPPFAFFGLFTDPEGIGSDIASSFAGVDFDTSSETIAGQSGKCFKASADISGSSSDNEWCWAEDGGVLLRLRTESTVGGQTSGYKLEAVDVGEVSADDFQPPYPVTDIPGT
jgi:hypothetical protein